MQIFLTGGTGYLGGAVLAELLAQGHTVRAHARSQESAQSLTAAGATPVVGELADTDWLGGQLSEVEGLVHCASPNDATSADLDTAVVEAALASFAGTDRPYVHTGGSWIHGSGAHLTEGSPCDPPPIVGWRPAVNDRVRAGAQIGVRSVVIGPANLYGRAGGLLPVISNGPTSGDPETLVVPGGHQHVGNVYVEDIARLFRLALEQGPPGSYYLGANVTSPTMAEVAAAASRLRGLDGRWQGESEADSAARLGPIAVPLLLDQQLDCSAARALGWAPTGPSLLDELGADGSYAATIGATR